MAKRIITISVDPGLEGAVAAFSLDPRALAVRCGIGHGGYYSGISSGRLPIRTALATIKSCIHDVIGSRPETLKAAGWELWGVVEQPGLWRGRTEGAAHIAKTSSDQRTWRNALDLVCSKVLPDRQAQQLDKLAGLRRSTHGRRGRKLEVREFNLCQVAAGRLPPFCEVPPGCSKPQDGIHDAVLGAYGLMRFVSGGVL